jgi:hypothetical protein
MLERVADLYLVELRQGPAWDYSLARREQEGWDQHAEFMDALVDEAFVVLGGPVGDGDGHEAVLVVDAPDEETVRARLAADPWAGKVLVIETIRPWSVWLRAGRGAG